MAQDVHADLHDIAARGSQPHQEVTADEGDWETALAKLNKELTKRINDMRTDNDTFQAAVSKSVAKLTDDVHALHTAVQNNKDAIEAQDALIGEANTKADAAKAAADANARAVQAVQQQLTRLEAAYAAHTHDLTVSFQGETTGPKNGGGA
jgi:DNA repair exonuclease SbcCD ATPase subunit